MSRRSSYESCLLGSAQPDLFLVYRHDGRRHVLGRALVIRRSFFCVLLCFPIRLAGPACYPGPCYFCLTGDGVRAGLRAYMPLCLGHEVAVLPHHTLEAQALMIPLQVRVATYTLGNFWLGSRVRDPRLPGPQSIYLLADLTQLEDVVAFSSGFLLWQ